jgi:hypothetical protein
MLARVLELPFRLRGHDGVVSVSYGVNEDPDAWGFDLFDLPFDRALVRGFPLMLATITFAGSGYRALMGWIQVATVEERTPPRTWSSVDVYPMHWETDTPFVTFGHAPALFDAPGPNPPRANERWTAETFLAICPDGARSRIVAPVLGFRWGYELDQMRATPFPPVSSSEEEWRRCLVTLEEGYPSWEFRPAFLNESEERVRSGDH